ncbi:MAG: FeoB-associated Cys-rich membrane protein [Clostridiales bacterium]|nr:FeoB-associated Cys-rich membrane protein [Clostridiales bacterium]
MKDMLLFVLAGFATAAFAVGHIVWKKREQKGQETGCSCNCAECSEKCSNSMENP